MSKVWEYIDKARKAITEMEFAAMATHPEIPDLIAVQSHATIASCAIDAFVVAIEEDIGGSSCNL